MLVEPLLDHISHAILNIVKGIFNELCLGNSVVIYNLLQVVLGSAHEIVRILNLRPDMFLDIDESRTVSLVGNAVKKVLHLSARLSRTHRGGGLTRTGEWQKWTRCLTGVGLWKLLTPRFGCEWREPMKH